MKRKFEIIIHPEGLPGKALERYIIFFNDHIKAVEEARKILQNASIANPALLVRELQQ